MGRGALITGLVVGLACAGCAERAARVRVVPGLVATVRLSRAQSGRSERLADRLKWEMNVGLRWRSGPIGTAVSMVPERFSSLRRSGARPVPCADEGLCAWEQAARARALLELAP